MTEPAAQKRDIVARAAIIVLGMILALPTLWPVFKNPRADSFPFSTYPMFASDVRSGTLELVQALAVFPDGNKRPLPPKLAVDNQEEIAALMTLFGVANRGESGMREHCQAIVERIRQQEDGEFHGATAIEFVRSTFDTVRYFDGASTPLRREILFRCQVPE